MHRFFKPRLQVCDFPRSSFQILAHGLTVPAVGIEGLKVGEIDSKVSPYWSVSFVKETISTQIDCVQNFHPGKVLVAEYQSAGRGRLDRKFIVPPGKGLTFSLCLPLVENFAWIPLITGLACSNAINRYLGEDLVEIKWPNDLLIDNLKLGGILSEKVGDGVVVGIGINILQSQEELPIKEAISLSMIKEIDRSQLLIEILNELAITYQDIGNYKIEYMKVCSTIGRKVLVTLPNGDQVDGIATEVNVDGALLVNGQAISAGDILHLR